MSAAADTPRHQIHRKGAIADLIRRDEEYIATGITDGDTRIIWQAIMLAPTLQVAEALLRGENVPTSAFNPEWAKRYGL